MLIFRINEINEHRGERQRAEAPNYEEFGTFVHNNAPARQNEMMGTREKIAASALKTSTNDNNFGMENSNGNGALQFMSNIGVHTHTHTGVEASTQSSLLNLQCVFIKFNAARFRNGNEANDARRAILMARRRPRNSNGEWAREWYLFRTHAHSESEGRCAISAILKITHTHRHTHSTMPYPRDERHARAPAPVMALMFLRK